MSLSHLALVWLHLLSAIAWIGGMLFLSLVLAPLVRRRTAAPEFAALFRSAARRFRFVVWAAVAALVSTGFILLSQRGLSIVDPTGWPAIVRVKLGLVALLVALTATHDLALGPRVGEIAAIPESARLAWEHMVVRGASWLPRLALLLALAVIASAVVLARS